MKHGAALKLAALSCVLFLASCLPDSNSGTAVSQSGLSETETGNATYTAQSLTNYALRSQYEMTKTKYWSNGSLSEGVIDMGGVSMGNAGKLGTSAFCRDSANNGYHLTWLKKGTSTGGVIFSALSGSVAPESLAMAKEGKVVTQSGREIVLSAACRTNLTTASADIPVGAPVIVMALSIPVATNMAGQTKVSFETVACTDGRETGSRLEKIVTVYDSNGVVAAGYPRRTQEGSTCAIVAATQTTPSVASSSVINPASSIPQIGGGVGSVLSSTLAAAKIDCASAQQEVVKYDRDGKAYTEKVEIADTCKTGEVDITPIEEIKDFNLTGDFWEPYPKELSCESTDAGSKDDKQGFENVKKGTWTWDNWGGNYTLHRWVDVVGKSEKAGEVTKMYHRGPWEGNEIKCTRDETFNVECASLKLPVETPEPSCEGADRSFKTDGRCYGFFATHVTWDQAKDKCESWGGEMATIRNSKDNELFSSLGTEVWLGFTDKAKEGDWKWINGEPVTYTAWSKTQPDNGKNNNEHCAHTFYGDHGKKDSGWNDNECWYEQAGALCMKRADKMLGVVKAVDYKFTRTNSVTTWKDQKKATPGPVDNGEWEYKKGYCEWFQKDEFGDCPAVAEVRTYSFNEIAAVVGTPASYGADQYGANPQTMKAICEKMQCKNQAGALYTNRFSSPGDNSLVYWSDEKFKRLGARNYNLFLAPQDVNGPLLSCSGCPSDANMLVEKGIRIRHFNTDKKLEFKFTDWKVEKQPVCKNTCFGGITSEDINAKLGHYYTDYGADKYGADIPTLNAICKAFECGNSVGAVHTNRFSSPGDNSLVFYVNGKFQKRGANYYNRFLQDVGSVPNVYCYKR